MLRGMIEEIQSGTVVNYTHLLPSCFPDGAVRNQGGPDE